MGDLSRIPFYGNYTNSSIKNLHPMSRSYLIDWFIQLRVYRLLIWSEINRFAALNYISLTKIHKLVIE